MKSFLCVLRNFASHDCLFLQKCPHTRFKRRFLVYFYHFWPFFSGFFFSGNQRPYQDLCSLFSFTNLPILLLSWKQTKQNLKKQHLRLFNLATCGSVCKSTSEILHEELAAHKSCYDRHILRHPYHEWCFNTSFFATNSMMFEWFSSSIILPPERLSSFSFVSKMGTHTSLKINVLK